MNRRHPTIRPSVWLELAAIAVLSIAVAAFGQPRPFALTVAALGGVTLAVIAGKELDR